MTRVWLQSGQVVHIGGIPYRLVNMTEAETHPNNIDLSNAQIAEPPAARPEEQQHTGMALAMKEAPTIKDAVMHAMRQHYWDSLAPHRDLILRHIEGALNSFLPQGDSQ